jgi:hypothetical protein
MTADLKPATGFKRTKLILHNWHDQIHNNCNILQHTNANNVEVQNMNLKQMIIIHKIPTIITILNFYTKLHFYQQTKIVPKI